MKKLSIIVATCFLLAISYSCADSFLDKKPLGSTSEDVFYSEKGTTWLKQKFDGTSGDTSILL